MGWFRNKKKNKGPDYSSVTSIELANSLVESGDLVPMRLLPEIFGGDDHPANIVFVPPFAADLKKMADENIIQPPALQGKITRYNAAPSYSGQSFVPTKVTIEASDPGEFRETVGIWGDGLTEA